MRETPPTAAEAAFFDLLSALVPDAQDWYHADDDGTPWMTASFDDVVDDRADDGADDRVENGMSTTWRVDFDGHELIGGRSPSNLNWDDGVRGRATGMNLEPPEGLVAKVPTADVAARVAAEWLNRVTQGRARP